MRPDRDETRWTWKSECGRTHGHHYLQIINAIVMINHIMIIIFRTTTLTAGVFEKGHLSLAALISPWKGACYDKKITLLSDDVIWPRWRRFKLMLKFVARGEMAMSVSWSVRYFGSRLKYLIKAYSLATWPSSQAKKTKTKVGIQISSGNPDVSAVIKAH